MKEKGRKEEGNLQWFPLTERVVEALKLPPIPHPIPHPAPQPQAPPILTNEVAEANMPGRLLSILLRESYDH